MAIVPYNLDFILPVFKCRLLRVVKCHRPGQGRTNNLDFILLHAVNNSSDNLSFIPLRAIKCSSGQLTAVLTTLASFFFTTSIFIRTILASFFFMPSNVLQASSWPYSQPWLHSSSRLQLFFGPEQGRIDNLGFILLHAFNCSSDYF